MSATPKTLKRTGTGMAFSDIHADACHPDFVKFLGAMVKKWGVKWAVCAGDITTQHLWSKHLHEVDAKNNADALASTRTQLRPFFKLFPKLDLVYGNHDLRHIKRAKELGLPEEIFKSFHEIFGCPAGWNFYEWFIVENRGRQILVDHGERKMGMNALDQYINLFNRCIITGHLHSQGGKIVRRNNGIEEVWACNAGTGADPEHYDMRYAKTSALQGVRGCIIIVDGEPIWESFDLWLSRRGK